MRRVLLPDGLDHAEAHLHAAVGVVGAWLRQAGHAVVTISQDFDSQTVVFLKHTGQSDHCSVVTMMITTATNSTSNRLDDIPVTSH